MKPLLAAISTAIAISTYSWSAIIVTSSDGFSHSQATTSTFNFANSDFSITNAEIAAADKLVVALTWRQSAVGSGMTYDGDAMTLIASANDGWSSTQLWYIDKSTATGGAFNSGNLAFTITGEKNVGVGIMALTGTADGVANFASATNDDIAFTPGAPNSLVVSSFSLDDGATGNAPTATAPSGATSFLSYDNVGTSDGGAAYWEDQANTETTYTWTNGATQDSMVIASFAAIPEPSSVLLIGLGAIVLAGRRRR